jgi:hypothetical protein
MNMNNELQIKTAVLVKVLDKSITTMNIKQCNRVSGRIMPIQINMFNIRELSMYVSSFIVVDS